MAIDIIENLENASLGRPLKGLMLENGLHIFDTKQEILDQQTLSLGRVKDSVIFARDIKKFLVFDSTGENYEEKDVPGGSGKSYSGQGLGVPESISVGNTGVTLTEPVGYYISQSNRPSLLTITVNDTDGYSEFRVIYDNANNVTRDVTVSTDGIAEDTKSIENGEVWECRVTLDRDSVGGNTFFWSKLNVVGNAGYDGEGFGVPGKTLVEDGTVVQTQITGNYRNSSDKAGNLTINVRTDDGVKNWRFYYNIPRGSISARKVYVKVDEKAGTNKTINSGETWQCEVKAGQFFDEFFWSQIMDSSSTFMTPEETGLLIEENNDEIITPNQGTQFQLIDTDKASGYGDNGTITYYGPNYSAGQAGVLVNKLANSKSYFVHKETSSQYGFAMLHESYVSQIYGQDVTGISELTMLFGPKSRGRYAKYNQVTPAGMVLNWNGEYLPDTEDPNAVNPTSWIDLNGNVTTEWSKTGIKTACYSIGLMANDGSALLQRGDVFCHDNAGVKTSTFTADSASEFFVIPIKTGGATLSDLKLLPLFMSRFYKLQDEWDSYTFDDSADCVGTILKIAYDAAIEVEETEIKNEETQLLAGMAGGQLFVKTIQVG